MNNAELVSLGNSWISLFAGAAGLASTVGACPLMTISSLPVGAAMTTGVCSARGVAGTVCALEDEVPFPSPGRKIRHSGSAGFFGGSGGWFSASSEGSPISVSEGVAPLSLPAVLEADHLMMIARWQGAEVQRPSRP